MGKGDKKTKRGKIKKGSFGARRPQKPRNHLAKPVKTQKEREQEALVMA
ncbi:30S ribosomal protein THX [Sediminitomix flava]|uniref:30S ribosomal protein S31 n=1 Tax=Sediminitomix flava TaxID=379075 RepID=A0A315ZFS6_SEDFL|nr:30S ribosomal protein THX [Sediminitomix flava]PWJ44009.1 30S ribosomal protein S31 [Sediminitomix flava]